MAGETTLGEAQIPIRATLDKLDSDLKGARNKVTGMLSGLHGQLEKGFKQIGMLGGVAAAGVAAIGGALAKVTIDAAPVEAVRDAFNGLAESAGVGGDAMLKALQEGSGGMVSQRDLMMSFNKAAQLVGADFATQLPDAMQYLAKVSAATGEDMNFMLDSLVTGVGRMSPMILDNLGIQTSLADATAVAADMFGVEADELTDAQIQAGMMNDVLNKLEENTAAMPDVTDTAAGKMAQLKARFQDTKDEIGAMFLPILLTVMEKFGELADTVLPPLMEILQTVSDIVGTFFENLDSGMDPLTAAEEALKEFLPPELAEGISEIADGIRDIVDWVKELVAAAEPYIEQVANWISENVELKDILIGVGIALATVLVPAIWALISPILTVIAVGAALALLIAGVRKAWEEDFLGIRTLVETTIAKIKEWWTAHGEEIMTKAKEIWDTVKTAVEEGLEKAKEIISNVIAKIKEWWAEHGEEIMAKAQEIWDGVVATFEWFKEQFQKLFEAFKLAFEGDWRGFGEKLREIWDEAWAKLKEIGENVWQAIQDFFTQTDWGAIGKSILEGIARGITAGLSFIRDAARNAAQSALDAAKGFLGIDSPSRAFEMQVGLPSVQGWARGLENTRPIEQAARSLANLSLSSANAGLQDNSRTMTVTINTEQSTGSIYRDLALVEAMLL